MAFLCLSWTCVFFEASIDVLKFLKEYVVDFSVHQGHVDFLLYLALGFQLAFLKNLRLCERLEIIRENRLYAVEVRLDVLVQLKVSGVVGQRRGEHDDGAFAVFVLFCRCAQLPQVDVVGTLVVALLRRYRAHGGAHPVFHDVHGAHRHNRNENQRCNERQDSVEIHAIHSTTFSKNLKGKEPVPLICWTKAANWFCKENAFRKNYFSVAITPSRILSISEEVSFETFSTSRLLSM